MSPAGRAKARPTNSLPLCSRTPPAVKKRGPHLWRRASPRILRMLVFVIQGKFDRQMNEGDLAGNL